MPFPSFFVLLLVRRLYRLRAFSLALAGLLGAGAAQAAIHKFDGSPAGGCTLAGSEYSCASLDFLGESGTLVIGAGYTLKLAGSATFSQGQGLSMQAGAKLVVAGSLDLRALKPAKLNVAGVSIEASDAIAIGPGATITGNVTAGASLSLDAGGMLRGSADTDSLVLEADALVDGSAWVAAARLEWHGRVSGTIYCKGGTANNKCDCVTNNSGYAVNSARGPRCEGKGAGSVHHYLITHDGQASSCASEPVTVTACANAACSAPHASSAPSVNLSPGGGLLGFGDSGVAQASVSSIQAGSISLALATSLPVACANTATGSASCMMAVSDKTAFEIAVPDHRAGEVQATTLQALKPANNRKSCVPAFKDVTVNVGFSCAHVNPASGRDYLNLAAKGQLAENASAPLACSGIAAGAAPTTRLVPVSFDANGLGAVSMSYPDAGSVRLRASYSASNGDKVEGEGLFTAVPYRFGVAAVPPASDRFVAGLPFELRLTALNKLGGATRGFDIDLLPGATGVVLDSCAVLPLRPGGVSPGSAAGFQDGVASVQLAWSEVGSMGVNASLTGFLGTGMGSSGSSGDCGSIGPFVPAFLQVERAPAVPARGFDYAGQPIDIVVSARNQQGELTRNYERATGRSEDVALAAVVTAGGPGGWATGPDPIPAAAFTEGKAGWSGAYALTRAVSPAAIAIRATSASASSQERGELLKTEVRLGRLRLGSRFGGHKATLSVPVTAEYWTGKSWLLNSDDNHTAIAPAAFAFRPTAAGMQPAPAFAASPLRLAGGAAAFDLRLAAGGPGPVDIALNLGSGTQDEACIGASAGSGVATLGAGMPWLRPLTTGCGTTQTRDPYGRATFGIPAPENRRIVHVREVFN